MFGGSPVTVLRGAPLAMLGNSPVASLRGPPFAMLGDSPVIVLRGSPISTLAARFARVIRRDVKKIETQANFDEADLSLGDYTYWIR
jgi:hypothetical protein